MPSIYRRLHQHLYQWMTGDLHTLVQCKFYFYKFVVINLEFSVDYDYDRCRRIHKTITLWMRLMYNLTGSWSPPKVHMLPMPRADSGGGGGGREGDGWLATPLKYHYYSGDWLHWILIRVHWNSCSYLSVSTWSIHAYMYACQPKDAHVVKDKKAIGYLPMRITLFLRPAILHSTARFNSILGDSNYSYYS